MITTPFPPQSITLSPDERITIRLLEPTDSSKLIDYLNGLSAQTKRYFGPHSFDPDTVNTICATSNPGECMRLIALSPNGHEIIAYVLLLSGATPSDTARYETWGISINSQVDCSLAPSIADAYQSRGLGNHLMSHTLRCAGLLRKKRVFLWGGVQAGNDRAVRYYRKYGFQEIAQFEHNGPNYAMCLSID